MQRLLKLGITFGLVGAFSYGADWDAKLLDAVCYDTTQTKSTGDKMDRECAPTEATSAFAIHTDDKVYKLDASGNDKAAALTKSGAIKRDHDGDMKVKVEGSKQGNMINVKSIKGR